MEPTTKRYAAIDNGIVVNFIIGYENCEHPYDEIICIEEYEDGKYPIMIGASYANGKFLLSQENFKEIQRQEEILLNNLKVERNKRLQDADILILRHLENNEPVPQSLRDYRQALRDLPENIEDVRNPEWPTYP